jgi:hypothetical protein
MCPEIFKFAEIKSISCQKKVASSTNRERKGEREGGSCWKSGIKKPGASWVSNLILFYKQSGLMFKRNCVNCLLMAPGRPTLNPVNFRLCYENKTKQIIAVL